MLRPQKQHIRIGTRLFLFPLDDPSLERLGVQDGNLGVTLSDQFLHHPRIGKRIIVGVAIAAGVGTFSSSSWSTTSMGRDFDNHTVGARCSQAPGDTIRLGFSIETKRRALQDYNGQQ